MGEPSTLVIEAGAVPSRVRPNKVLCVSLLCLAQFLDVFNSSAIFAMLPSVSSSLGLQGNSVVWILSAYQLTFASFLLLSGRISDVHNPKNLFCTGVFVFGLLSLGSGFLKNGIIFLIFRATIGIAASLTIPSALYTLSHLYEGDASRSTAITFFNGSVALANVTGIIIGAVVTDFLSWRWVFWIEAMLAVPTAALAFFKLPKVVEASGTSSLKPKIDWVGIVTLTVFLLLFVLGVTSGSSAGWSSAITIAPLVFSAVLASLFFIWERRLPLNESSLSPMLWRYPNFWVLVVVALTPFLWWSAVFFAFTSFWQSIYLWSPLKAAIHLLPIGILAIVVMGSSAQLAGKVSPKWVTLFGEILVIMATLILPFADRPSRYWSFAFPAFCLGTTGTSLIYTHANIAILLTTPQDLAGTVGAIFNTALQIGSAIGVATISSLQSNIDERDPGPFFYNGRAAGFWLLLGYSVVPTLLLAWFYDRNPTSTSSKSEYDLGKIAVSFEPSVSDIRVVVHDRPSGALQKLAVEVVAH